jgi:predicted MFS family arabinose efflux permease
VLGGYVATAWGYGAVTALAAIMVAIGLAWSVLAGRLLGSTTAGAGESAT